MLRRGLSLLRVSEGALGIVLLKHSDAREDRIGSHALLGAVAHLALHAPHHALSRLGRHKGTSRLKWRGHFLASNKRDGEQEAPT